MSTTLLWSGSAAHHGIAGVGPLLAIRCVQPAEVTGVGVLAEDEGPHGGVADDRDRGGVHLDPLEQVEVHAEGVGQQRLDDVAVADGDPGGGIRSEEQTSEIQSLMRRSYAV